MFEFFFMRVFFVAGGTLNLVFYRFRFNNGLFFRRDFNFILSGGFVLRFLAQKIFNIGKDNTSPFITKIK
ncbi:hypothetical protein FXB70_00495 [Aggregatibacter actinomycetemcomitans]|nr:hypothetical protein FXN59_07165 [Aggregatibacter actinomycetemcomitans]TYA23354.1 hypothetical protein FXB91_05360 [Aggregatibacter actinomycetemcomitans]TYA27362.1 hypothetical protein FXB92_04620 [Aggregatibacter actinomycetemcomitans]TYA29215.1 hypothetical protein FXB96_05230 [Aggregatibacter actinomycetemcomitans]TYA36975.1 hypothetical protein FXE06_05675 [Aggregatibacter actinomycetemcomitans]